MAETKKTIEKQLDLDKTAETLGLGQAKDILAQAQDAGDWLWSWFQTNILTVTSGLQVAVIAISFLLSFAITSRLRRFINRLFGKQEEGTWLAKLQQSLHSLIFPIAFFILLSLSALIFKGTIDKAELIRIILSLLSAWIVIRLVSNFFANAYWSRVFALLVWIVAALSVLGLLQPTVKLLDDIGFEVSGSEITVFAIIRGVAVCAFALWLASAGSQFLQVRVDRLPNLTASSRTLISKALKILLLFMAVMITLNTIGLDLTAFTVFSGAIGVGIGFGLQKIVANFIAGIILLMDRSVKPGDVIEVAGTYGVVRGLGARFAAVRTRDGTEHLIPNEEFIIKSVINWTHSDKIVRRKALIGISYNADVDSAIALVVEAAGRVERVISTPAPICLLNSFGDSSVNLEVRFWIADPENGLANVTSEVLLEIWRSFQEHKVEIPFPQRDLHLRAGDPVHVHLTNDGKD